MTVGERIAAEARAWLGTPHVNMAKVKGVGVDCGMLLIGVLEGAQIIKPDTISIAPYSNMWHLSHSEEWFLRYVQKYCNEVTDLRIGDFLLYKYGRCISHAAIYIGHGKVIPKCKTSCFMTAAGSRGLSISTDGEAIKYEFFQGSEYRYSG